MKLILMSNENFFASFLFLVSNKLDNQILLIYRISYTPFRFTQSSFLCIKSHLLFPIFCFLCDLLYSSYLEACTAFSHTISIRVISTVKESLPKGICPLYKTGQNRQSYYGICEHAYFFNSNTILFTTYSFVCRFLM